MRLIVIAFPLVILFFPGLVGICAAIIKPDFTLFCVGCVYMGAGLTMLHGWEKEQ